VNALRVLIVAEDPLARAGIAATLADEPEVDVVGRLGLSDGVAAEAAAYRPDIVLLDVGWDSAADDETLEAMSDLVAAGMPLLALVAGEMPARQAWAAGAAAILLRDSDEPALLAALRAANAGLVVLDPALSVVVSPRPRETEPLIEDLTPREMEVLQLVADGLTNRAIALRLGISENTVKFHLNGLLGKLSAQSRTDAVVRATRLGLIAL